MRESLCLGGVCDIDYWKASFWKDFVGVTVRTYDRRTGLWRIYWIDNTFSGGVIGYRSWDNLTAAWGNSRDPIRSMAYPSSCARYTWTLNPTGLPIAAKWEQALNPSGSPVVAKWEQAFSKDRGKSWETKWYNEFIHDDNCTPAS
jgi:hypothetical protein